MKIAAVDVGTNSIRTVIADVHGNGTFSIIDQLREMVRLGEGESPELGLTTRAMVDGLRALDKSRTLCDAHKVDKISAVATSAVREAVNGGRFVAEVRQQTGIELDVISAEEEARLIYLGARDSIDLGERRGLFVDVGGGSVEFVIGDHAAIMFIASVKLGVLRLLNQFSLADPAKPKQIQAVQEHIDEVVRPVLARIREVGFDRLIVTSGTSLTLLGLTIDRTRTDGPSLGSLNQQVISANAFLHTCDWMVKSTAAERRSLDRIHLGRLYSIVPGAIFWSSVLDKLAIREMIASEYALREGMLIDFIQKQMPGIRQWERYPNPRRRSVIALAQRCHWDESHSRQVAVLSLALFDQLAPFHQLDPAAREWLDYAAILHDIGYHISARAHHRHSYYLIMHADLLGFSQEEIRIIAAITRYHRKRKPSRTDPELIGLEADQRRTIEILAGVLRVADALDRTHNRVIERVQVVASDGAIVLDLLARADAELELWFAGQKVQLLGESLDKEIRLRLSENQPFILQDGQKSETTQNT